jgi:hypothetical protein
MPGPTSSKSFAFGRSPHELELDEVAVALREQDVVRRRPVDLVHELEVVVVVEELEAVLLGHRARLVEVVREARPVDGVVRAGEPGEAPLRSRRRAEETSPIELLHVALLP